MSYPNWGGAREGGAEGQTSFYLISTECKFYKMRKFWGSV